VKTFRFGSRLGRRTEILGSGRNSLRPCGRLNLELGTWNLELGNPAGVLSARECNSSKFRVQSSKFRVQPAAGASPCRIDPSTGFFSWSLSSNAKLFTWCVLLALMFLTRSAFLFSAAAEEKVMSESRDTVIVPYDPKKPVKDQHPDKVYLNYDRFLELWEAAKKSRTPEKEAFAAAAYALGAARYEGRVEEKRAVFKVTLEFSTFDEPWVRVPLPFEGVQISELAVDGKPAAFAEGALVVEKPGKHSLTAAFEIPLAAGAREFAWGIPRTAATRLLLTLPETRWTARIQPDAGVIEHTVDGKKTVTAALGTTARISVALTEAEGTARVVEPATADVETAALALAGYERFETAIHFGFADAQQDHFSVNFEKGFALAMLDAPGMKSWKLTDGGEKQVLEVLLAEPAKESFRLAFATERVQATVFPADRSVPPFVPGARRVNRTVSLFSGAGIAVAAAPDAVLRQVELAQQERIGLRLVGAWTGTGALGYRVSLAESGHEARVDYVYQVNRRKIELIASLQLHAKDAPLFDVSLTLPANFDVQAVDSVRLQDWWRDGRKLRVRFKDTTPEMTPLVVYLVREYAAAPQQLDVQPLALDGFSKVTGEAVIAAHKGVSASLALDGAGAADAAREVDPAKAAPDFQILPPLERKRGFAFKNQKFSGQVTLAALPVKQSTTWMMHAQAFEAWLSLSMKAQVTLRQGSIERTGFSLPAALPEAKVTGPEVRETRSRVEGERRIYDVQFQNDVYDTVDFTVDVDLTMTEGKRADGRKVNEIALPAPEFPESQMTTGYVIADNASEYELKLETDGVEPAQASVIPWLPSVTKSAGIFRVQPVWKVALVLERLEKAEVRTAFCAWAEMTTALREDGTEWHKAVWHLQNRSLQFLPVKLPDGASLVSARVAGQGVRADSGKVNGRDAILIPLIKTRPGDVSYDVEVVWSQAGGKLAPRDRRKFHDAELIGITVEQTFWAVWLPDSRALTQSDGNMAEVVEVSRDVEKARSALQEMIALNGIIADPSASEEVRFNAKQNWAMTCTQVQMLVTKNNQVLQGGRYSNSVKQQDEAGGKDLQAQVQKLAVANFDIGTQLAKIEEDNKHIEQQRQAGGAGAFNDASQSQQQAATNVDSNGLQMQQNAGSANRAQALLFGNNTYTGATNISAGTLNTANTAANGIVISNGAIVAGQGALNVQGGMVQQFDNNAVTAQSNTTVSNVQNARWATNPVANNVQAQPTAPAETKAGDTRNFYLNDNIVLQQAKTGKGTLTLNKSGAGTLTLDGTNTFSGAVKGNAGGKPSAGGLVTSSSVQYRGRGESETLKMKADDKESNKIAPADEKGRKDADRDGENLRTLNYARGNRQQQMEQAQVLLNADVQQPAQRPMSEARPQSAPVPLAAPVTATPPPAPPGGPAPQSTAPAMTAAQPRTTMSFSTANGGTVRMGANGSGVLAAGGAPGNAGAVGNAPANVEQQALQQLGRLSLAVDFPVQGHVHHFQKAKASAVLEVSFADPHLTERWIRIAIFAALAVLVWLAGWGFSARRVRRAVAI
jgi:autotransporter-associated beta strand protein